MPELRRDPIAGRWVIISPDRGARPGQFKPTERYTRTGPTPCPFCEGNESKTPPEIRVLRENGPANGPGWRVRVVPNKFPALGIEGELNRRQEGVFDAMNGIGAHEVIIESPKHLLSTADQTAFQVSETLWSYKERILDLTGDKRFVYCLIFKNVGEAAGATLEHTHSQLIATPIIPVRVQAEIDRCRQYFDANGGCLFCDMLKQEVGAKVRILSESEHFVALEPFAPRFPFETWIFPREHASHYERIDDKLLSELGHVLRDTITRIEGVAKGPSYNYLIHTAPMSWGPSEHYHWHFEVFPRLTRVAGFEWGTGFYINPLPPEDAARYLREVKLETGGSVS